MTQDLRIEYLRAMDIPVWVLRAHDCPLTGTATPCAVQLGPGQGQVLILCSAIDEPSRKLCADIARSMKSEPVWGWPLAEGDGESIDAAVSEKLFTHILVLGPEAESLIFGGPAPELIGSATVVTGPSVSSLEASADDRRRLWTVICRQRLAGPRNQTGDK